MKSGRRSSRKSAIPADIEEELKRAAADLAQRYWPVFIANPRLKGAVSLLFRRTLPPLPKRPGRPANTDITRTIALLEQFRCDYPNETPRQLWAKVYGVVVPNYAAMNEVDRKFAKRYLRDRVRWRLSLRKRAAKGRSVLVSG